MNITLLPVQEILDLFAATFSIQDADAKLKARQDIVAGPLKTKLDKLMQLLVSQPGEPGATCAVCLLYHMQQAMQW